jgi:hypothetical protein
MRPLPQRCHLGSEIPAGHATTLQHSSRTVARCCPLAGGQAPYISREASPKSEGKPPVLQPLHDVVGVTGIETSNSFSQQLHQVRQHIS